MKPHLLTATLVLIALPAAAQDSALDQLTHTWRDDPVWHDGKAEIAEYEATRTIYGNDRAYTARLMTNKEHADPDTKTKDPAGQGRAVFKFHARDDIPTPKYDYHYSTMCYVGVDDMKSLKIDMGAQEDCGATFKQVVNHAGELSAAQFSYFPNEGRREDAFEPPTDLVFADALPLVLRGYPFDNPPPPDQGLPLKVLPEQTYNHWTPVRPDDYVVTYVGRQTLDLPIGPTDAHHLQLRFVGPTREARPPMDLWFAADGSAPMLHALVKLRAPTEPRGSTQQYELKSLRREAYWVN